MTSLLFEDFIYKKILHKDANVKKLATREDPYHVHKTLGILSVLNFIYRYAYVYNTQGNLGYDGQDPNRDYRMIALDWATMIVHTMLALSSIQFRVPKFRINNKPMVIYEEYRQHAMVFTTRCFSVFVLAYLFPQAPVYVAPIVVMGHHLLADRITSIWGTPGNTAVRATGDSMNLSSFYKAVAQLYSLYQFLAIGSHIIPNGRLADMAFNAIIAIQSSAFMMTLYRKRIIRGTTHMIIYASCLVISAFHIVKVIGLTNTLAVIVTFLVRTKIPRSISSKYFIWFLFLVGLNREYFTRVVNIISPHFMKFLTSDSKQTDMVVDFQSLLNEEDVHFAWTGGSLALLVYVGFATERLIFYNSTKQEQTDPKKE